MWDMAIGVDNIIIIIMVGTMVGIMVIIIKNKVTIVGNIVKHIIMDIVKGTMVNFVKNIEGLIISMDLT